MPKKFWKQEWQGGGKKKKSDKVYIGDVGEPLPYQNLQRTQNYSKLKNRELKRKQSNQHLNTHTWRDAIALRWPAKSFRKK